MSFGRAFLSSCLGALVALISFFFIGIFLLTVLISGFSKEEEVIVKDNTVLHLRLDAEINELQEEDPFAGLPVLGREIPQIGLLQLKRVIEHAKTDDKIKGIFLEVSYPMTGFSTLEEIRSSLIDFRESGKWVVSYNEVMSEAAYYLSTAADEIYLNPEGEIEFNGLTAEIAFFKNLLNKLEIKPQVFRVGEFKSAVEPFLFDHMSAENRLQIQEMVNSIYDVVLTRISEEREVSKDKLENIADNMLVKNAATALDLKLIDALYYQDQFNSELRKRLGIGQDDAINFIRYSKYRKSFSGYKNSPNEIAVIVAEGAIVPGDNDQSERVIGADAYVEEIRKAREDSDVKAIVLRVNSPGGEFRSSDMIWREVQLAREKKPVIASMSDYAASGGYYLSMGCDTIVSQPHTITGSIGIFGILLDMSDFFGEKLGITFDQVRTGNFGDTYTITRPLTEAEKKFIQNNLEDHYSTFTKKAAEGRDISHDQLLDVASGRVWTGVQAKERRLVDVLGGFNDAVEIAAEKAGVSDDYKVRFYPEQKPFLQQLVSQLEENARVDRIKAEMGELHIWYDKVQKLNTYQGSQARMPFEMHIH